MLPPELTRAKYFNRNGREAYLEWVLGITGIPFSAEMLKYRTRPPIDVILKMSIPVDDLPVQKEEEEPEWVEAAIEVTGIRWSNSDNDEGLALTNEIQEELLELESEEVVLIEEEVVIEEPPLQETETEEVEESTPEVEEVVEVAVAPVISVVDNPFSTIDYNSWTVRELQEECRERGITIRGTKAEVVLRLRRNDDGIMDDTANGESEAPSEEAAEEAQDAPSEEAVTTGDENADSEQGEYTSEEE